MHERNISMILVRPLLSKFVPTNSLFSNWQLLSSQNKAEHNSILGNVNRVFETVPNSLNVAEQECFSIKCGGEGVRHFNDRVVKF